jgi:beta-glucosidase
MKSYLLSLCLVAGASVFGAETQPLYLDSSQPLETRVENLLSRLTLEEKNSLIHADSRFTTTAIPRLGIPRRWMSARRARGHQPEQLAARRTHR